MTVSVFVLLPTLVLAWIAGTHVARRVTTHVAQAGSAEVAANAAAMLRQSGLTVASAGDALIVRSAITETRAAWQYFDTVARRNPFTVGITVYDDALTVVYDRDRARIGSRAANDASFAAALAGGRETRLVPAREPTGPLPTGEASRSYGVLIPLVYPGGEVAGVLEVEHDIGPISSDMELARWMIVAIIVGVTLALVALTAYFTTHLARRSFFDPITALPNLRYLHAAARVVLEQSARSGRAGGLILVDIDRFKHVNETLGRAQGDRLLRELAERLRAVVRGNDYVARVGGDDFALLLPAADEASMRSAAERAASAIARPFRTDGREIRLEATAGVALFPRDAVDLDVLLQRAEHALERAKGARSAVAYYRRESDSARRHSLYLESDLRTAIERGELDIVYQPICHLPTGEILGLEALTRWEHPTRGPIAPSTFVDMAERSGFIDRLDRWTLREATAQLAAWSRSGSDVLVTVNMAAQTLSDPGLPAYIEELVAETAAPLQRLILEVTERTALEDFEASAGVLHRLRDTGIGIALDDFGRGHSSLSTLDHYPISFLKLDASFTRGIGNSPKDEHLLRAVKLFTKGIGIPFVVEGIETDAQRAWLIQEGVRYGQGYFFSRPTSHENIFPPRQTASGERLAPAGALDQGRGPN